jgi:hypothetical protein
MANYPKQLAVFVILLGIFSFILPLVGLHFKYLWFLDEFGPVVGFVFKGALIGLGVVIWRKAEVTSEDLETSEADPTRKPWVHILVSVAIVSGLVSFAVFQFVSEARADQRLNRRPAPAAWASASLKEWPPLVLLQQAEFKQHTPLRAGCVSLIRLPSGQVAALTVAHLLGAPGGVEPGFLASSLCLDRNKLATLDSQIARWKLFVPGRDDQTMNVLGLFGKPDQFAEHCDELLLRVDAVAPGFPVKVLDIRMKPVPSGEPLRVVRYAVIDEKAQQVAEEARRISSLGFTLELENSTDFRAATGAPVLDKDGLLVGIIGGKGPGSFEDVRVLSVEPVTELLPVLRAALK